MSRLKSIGLPARPATGRLKMIAPISNSNEMRCMSQQNFLRSPKLGSNLRFMSQAAQLLAQLFGAFCSAGNWLSVAVTPAQPAFLLTFVLAGPNSEPQPDLFEPFRIDWNIAPAIEHEGAEDALFQHVIRIEDHVKQHADTRIGVFLFAVFAATQVGYDFKR